MTAPAPDVNVVNVGRKSDIVRAARDLFLQSGMGGFTLRGVGARVGISAPAIYRHFENKDDLLREVVDLGRERFTTYLVRGLRGSTPRERLLLTGESYLEFAFEQPQDYQIMFMAWNQMQPGVHAPVRAGNAPMFQFLLDRVRECLPGRSEGASEVLDHALLFWAQCHGLASLYLSGGGRDFMPLEQYRALCRRLLEKVVTGVLG